MEKHKGTSLDASMGVFVEAKLIQLQYHVIRFHKYCIVHWYTFILI